MNLGHWLQSLPVAQALPALASALADAGAAVLEAPTGAGKTTLVPLALLDTDWLHGQRIVMLEPRRLAARAAARRMAAMLGERVGETVGYRTRLDTQIGPRSRIEVVTEGILLRRITADPALDGVGLVVFDEFHERSLETDLGLALVLDARRHLQPDLRVLVMSATLDGAPVAQLLGDAAVITSAGRAFAVALRYLGRPRPERFEPSVAAAIETALRDQDGGILVFLPGGREIRRVERLLRQAALGDDVLIAPLYGDLPQGAQDQAIQPPPPGARKIVLATSIAETSLTIEGITAVIDGGLRRVPRFEPASGMTRLVTVPVSQAASEQRRGRAGRLAPGICYRLWREAEQAQHAPFDAPEIESADLAPLALALAQWGCRDAATLDWLDPPPAAAYAEALALLRRLDAVDGAGRITAHGAAMTALGLPPRLAHMALRGKDWGLGWRAAALAAALVERDLVKAAPGMANADLRLRVDLALGREPAMPGVAIDRGAVARARRTAALFARQLGVRAADDADDGSGDGRLLAQAYPDRIALRRAGGGGQFLLANGRGAMVAPADPLAQERFLAVAELDGERREARIFLAAPLAPADLEADFAAAIETVDTIAWDERAEAVQARRQQRLGALVIKDDPLADPPGDRVATALIAGIRALGLGALAWSAEADHLRQRIAFLHRLEPQEWPDVDDPSLLATVEHWLAPHLVGVTRRVQFAAIDLTTAIAGLMRPDQRRALDRLAPIHVALPGGARATIDYGAGDTPVLAVKLQALFGLAATPTIAGGRVALVVHLLSPAGRPLQVTRDLASFWAHGYGEVRRAMRGRYPRHPWPENPLDAVPTSRAKPAQQIKQKY